MHVSAPHAVEPAAPVLWSPARPDAGGLGATRVHAPSRHRLGRALAALEEGAILVGVVCAIPFAILLVGVPLAVVIVTLLQLGAWIQGAF